MESGQTTSRRDIDGSDQVGRQLRVAREAKGMSLRELARRLEISASALSQIETGKSLPSVRTLYAIVSELGLSLDALFTRDEPEPSPAAAPGAAPDGEHGPVQRAESRASLQLDSGVTWDRLTADHDQDVDFLWSTYEVGGSSSAGDQLVRHSGREYGLVISGELEVTVGFETYRLKRGDSISFNSTEPHNLRNPGDAPAETVWVVFGRRESDPRRPSFEPSDG